MRFLLGLILLAFPIAEIWLLIKLAGQYGLLLVFYLVMIAWLGLRLIRDEKQFFTQRMMQTMLQGSSPFRAMFGSARNIIAGILLIIPGVISDVIAALILLIPLKNHSIEHSQFKAPPSATERSANDDVIEGEFRRED